MTNRKSHPMSREEAGRHGGAAVAERYGEEFYQEIGHRGGQATSEKYGPEHYRDIGHRGGQAVSEEYGPEFYREIGHRGGQARWGEEDREEYAGHRRPRRSARRHQAREDRWEEEDRNMQHDFRDEYEEGEYAPSRRTSREEAGRRGGQAVLEKYGPEYYREMGRRGGRR